MEYTTEYDEISKICTVLVTGTHKRPEDAITLQQFARSFGEEHGCKRFLFDMRKAEIIGGTGEAFETGTVPDDKNYKQIEQKISLVYSENLADHKFMENVAVNRGYQLRVFEQIGKAIEWLKAK